MRKPDKRTLFIGFYEQSIDIAGLAVHILIRRALWRCIMFRTGIAIPVLALMLGIGAASDAMAQDAASNAADNSHPTGSNRPTTSTTSGQGSSQQNQGTSQQNTPTRDNQNAQGGTNQPPALIVTSLQVMNNPATQKQDAKDAVTKNCSQAIALALDSPRKDVKAECPKGVNIVKQELVGAGDVLVSVRTAEYAEAMKYKSQGARQLKVFFNGFDVTDDAELIASEQIRSQTFLQYHLAPGKQSRTMWAALIRNGSLTSKVPLSLSFGWDNRGPNSLRSDIFFGDATIAVTDDRHLTVACVALAALLFVCLYFARKTSILRNTLPTTITDLLPAARALRQDLNQPGLTPAQQTALMQQADPKYPALYPAGNQAATQALEAALREPDKIKNPGSVVTGLALRDDADLAQALSHRMSFSLARVQLFCWFMFALLAGLFLWSIYTELPDLDNTMLALLGISAGTAGLSWTVDSSKPVTGTLSRGLLFDMATGVNNEYEVHRFQAVLVNLVLLAIGIGHIVSSIAYPVFDPSWLIFLGISGGTYLAGKELTK